MLGTRLIDPPPLGPDQYQPASLDLSIGAVVTSNQTVSYQDNPKGWLMLEPGGVATLLSREEIHLPLDFCGTAYPITRLAMSGLIALNLGHIDPGSHGPMQIKIMNVLKTSYPVNIGDRFVTVIFERMPRTAEPFSNTYVDYSTRLREARILAAASVPAALLDTQSGPFRDLVVKTVQTSLARVLVQVVLVLGGIAAFAASIIAILQFVVPALTQHAK
jgi:deoxycytidine triphosphate deaminase